MSISPSKVFLEMSISSIMALSSLGYWVEMTMPSFDRSVIWDDRMASMGYASMAPASSAKKALASFPSILS